MRDHLRDYCSAAFKFYAQNGKSVAKYKAKLNNDILYNRSRNSGCTGISKPTEAEVMHSQKIWDEKHAEINDMEAVERTIYILQQMNNGRNIIKAIEHVYFDNDSLHIAEIQIPANKRSIQRWLKQAKILFANERGLRIGA